MLLLSFRLNKKLVTAVCGLLGTALLAVVVAGMFATRGTDVAVSLNSSGAVTKNYTAATNEQRLAFAGQFGWEVESEPVEIKEVIIPKEFDEVYQGYEAIQKAQGLDLTRYAGQKVKRCTYQVLNYPGCKDEVRLNLLVAENKVIGGDVCSMALDGFMHGFKYEG